MRQSQKPAIILNSRVTCPKIIINKIIIQGHEKRKINFEGLLLGEKMKDRDGLEILATCSLCD